MTRALMVLPLVALAALTACSSDDGGGSESPKAAYVAQAVDVCEVADTDASALVQPTAPAGFRPFVDTSVAIITRAQGELAALTPPPDDADELATKVLDPLAALADRARDYAEMVAAAGTDQAKLLPLLAARPTAEGIDLEFLRSYGLGVCADVIEDRT